MISLRSLPHQIRIRNPRYCSDTDLFTDNDETRREGYYNGLFLLQRRIAEQNRVIKRPRNEHVPYLTPGNCNIHLYIICIIIIIYLLPGDRNIYLYIICILAIIKTFSGNPGNFEPLRDDDSEGPGMIIEHLDHRLLMTMTTILIKMKM